MINKAILVGNVGSEPEIKVSQKKKSLLDFHWQQVRNTSKVMK